jgi:hypothetical protein
MRQSQSYDGDTIVLYLGCCGQKQGIKVFHSGGAMRCLAKAMR